jgi:hypothetical protein
MTLVDIRPFLRSLLLANSNISTAVNDPDGKKRIYPTILPQGVTADSIVYTRVTEFETLTMERSTGLVSARYQLDAWSSSADRATTLANLIKEQIGGFRGQIVVGSDFADIQLIEVVNGRDDYDGVLFMYRVSKDYFIWYEERNA